jgi:hypothetical protein
MSPARLSSPQEKTPFAGWFGFPRHPEGINSKAHTSTDDMHAATFTAVTLRLALVVRPVVLLSHIVGAYTVTIWLTVGNHCTRAVQLVQGICRCTLWHTSTVTTASATADASALTFWFGKVMALYQQAKAAATPQRKACLISIFIHVLRVLS